MAVPPRFLLRLAVQWDEKEIKRFSFSVSLFGVQGQDKREGVLCLATEEAKGRYRAYSQILTVLNPAQCINVGAHIYPRNGRHEQKPYQRYLQQHGTCRRC